MRLSRHLGKDVVLLDFWATYCEPCLLAMPRLEQLYRKYREQGFAILAISLDGPESVAQVRTEVAKLGVTFPVLLDSETRVVALYNPRASAPFSVLINRNGQVVMKKEGYGAGDFAVLDTEIAEALQP